MSTSPKGRCVICGAPAADDHDCGGRSNVPHWTAPVCKPDHPERNTELWRAGVPLSHNRTPSEAEVGYATLVGVFSMMRAIVEALDVDTDKQTAALDDERNALLRHVFMATPSDERTFGPQPLAEAARKPLVPRSRNVVPLDELPAQLGGLMTLLANAGQRTLGEHVEHGEYVAAMAAAAEATPAALERLAAVSAERDSEWLSFDESARTHLDAFSQALADLHPLEPTEEQMAAVAAALCPLARIGAEWFSLFAALDDAETDEQANAALDRFFAACEAL